MSNYHPGGLHPTHIGDTFKHDRYTIVHQLGCGTYSTVWLARDGTTETYVSLKVLAADAARWSGNPNSVEEELQILSRVRDAPYETGKNGVVRLLDAFVHAGPNGEHQCIVTELLGPNLSEDIEDLYPNDTLPAAISRAIIGQLTHAVRFLHRNNIAHGDLHIGNVLLTSPKLSSLSDDHIPRYYTEADSVTRLATKAEAVTPHVPRYILWQGTPTPLLRLCLCPNDSGNNNGNTDVRVKICDFGASTIITPDTQPKEMHIPIIYRAPEVVLQKPRAPALSADVWALAVLFYYIYTGGVPIFSPGDLILSEDKLLTDIVLKLGKLPEPLWSAWEKRSKFFDEDGAPLPEFKREGNVPLLWCYEHAMAEEERVLFEEMLRPMLALDPEKRATIDDVVQSEWFVKFCGESSPAAPPGVASRVDL